MASCFSNLFKFVKHLKPLGLVQASYLKVEHLASCTFILEKVPEWFIFKWLECDAKQPAAAGTEATAPQECTQYTLLVCFFIQKKREKVAKCFSALFSNCFGKGRQRLTCATCELKTCQVSSLASVNGAERLLLIWCVASSWVSKWFSVWSIKEMLGWVPNFDWNALILLDNEKINPLSVPNSEMIWFDSMALYRHFWKKTNQSNCFWLY